MNNNVNGMVKINENTIVNQTVPSGFIVREKIVDGNPVSIEYGIYMTNDVFLGIPVHFNMKNKFIPTNNCNTAEYNYYLLPQDIQFGVVSYKNKKTNKINPLLVEPSDKCPAVLVSALAFGDLTNKIINVEVKDGSKVLRKFIDKDRNCVGIIAYNPDAGLINPTTIIDITYGRIGSNVKSVKTYNFGAIIPGGVEMHTVDNEVTDLKTEFINLPMFIEATTKKEERTARKSRFNKNNHHDNSNKRFNKTAE